MYPNEDWNIACIIPKNENNQVIYQRRNGEKDDIIWMNSIYKLESMLKT